MKYYQKLGSIILTTLTLSSVGLSSEKLSLELAKKIAGQAQEYALKKGLSVSVALVNDEGNLLYFERTPEAFPGSIDVSIQKAKSSNAFSVTRMICPLMNSAPSLAPSSGCLIQHSHSITAHPG